MKIKAASLLLFLTYLIAPLRAEESAFRPMFTLAQVMLWAAPTHPVLADDSPTCDIVVYGDSSGAITPAIAAIREGRSVIWLNPIT